MCRRLFKRQGEGIHLSGEKNLATNLFFCILNILCDDIFVPPYRVFFSVPFLI